MWPTKSWLKSELIDGSWSYLKLFQNFSQLLSQDVPSLILIAFEVFHYMKRNTRGKEGVMTLKIDI